MAYEIDGARDGIYQIIVFEAPASAVAEVERVLYGSVARDQAGLFQAVAPIEFSWRGLARYWRKRREREAAAQASV